MKKLLLLHGALGTRDQFENLRNALGSEFEVYTLDFYGHGSESNSTAAFGIQSFSNQVFDWLETKNLNGMDIFGYSMGGYVALKLASDHPEKVNRIFTLATKFDWTEATAAHEVRMLDPEKIELKVPAFAADLANRHGRENWKQVMRNTAAMMLELGRQSGALPNLAQLELPVQIGIGDRDMMVSLEETINAYRQIKNASLVVFPETTHPLEKVKEDRLAYEIKQFFK